MVLQKADTYTQSTLKIFFIVIFLSVIFSSVLIFISPQKIPTKFHNGEFTGLQSKYHAIFKVIFFPLFWYLICGLIYRFMPNTISVMKTLYPSKLLYLMIYKPLSFLFRAEVNDSNIYAYIRKFCKVLSVTGLMIIPFNFVIILGFAYQWNFMGSFSIAYGVFMVIFSLLLAVFLSRRIESLIH